MVVTDAATYRAILGFRAFVAPKKIGDKPPTFTINNVLINFNEITSCSIKEISEPVHKEDQSYTFTWTFIEYKASVAAKTGKADPAHPDGTKTATGAVVDPQVASLQKTRDELAAAIAKAA